MSTLQLLERPPSPFDILFRNHFNAEDQFAPALNSKQPHPLNIFYDDSGLHFEVACTGLTKKDVILDIEGDILKITYNKAEDKGDDFEGYIYHGLSKKSFDLRYKIAPKFDLSITEAEMIDGLLAIFIPLAEDAKPKSIKIK
jgi:HSP20 family molecular chaperone IbpA|tara:strand:+ start:3861 stop:4286 length:426 start_codon:yes stop_codon:yes gene_type:complete